MWVCRKQWDELHKRLDALSTSLVQYKAMQVQNETLEEIRGLLEALIYLEAMKGQVYDDDLYKEIKKRYNIQVN